MNGGGLQEVVEVSDCCVAAGCHRLVGLVWRSPGSGLLTSSSRLLPDEALLAFDGVGILCGGGGYGSGAAAEVELAAAAGSGVVREWTEREICVLLMGFWVGLWCRSQTWRPSGLPYSAPQFGAGLGDLDIRPCPAQYGDPRWRPRSVWTVRSRHLMAEQGPVLEMPLCVLFW